jgi:outer membrane protein
MGILTSDIFRTESKPSSYKGEYMKKVFLLIIAIVMFTASAASADSIAHKFGLTARGGASYLFNSEWTDYLLSLNPGMDKELKPGIGWAAGGGIMYGITNNLAVNFDIIYGQADYKFSNPYITATLGTFRTYDFSFGAEWRFMPQSRFVPYIGAGFDVLLNRVSLDDEFFVIPVSADIDTTYGAHVSVGADFFFTPHIALNAEIRGLYSTQGDVKFTVAGITTPVAAKYNPSNISGFLGIRFFFP